MGAEYNFKMLKASNKEDAIKEGEALIEKAKYDHGHGGYSGSWAECTGVKMHDEVLPPETDIEEWLDEMSDKWGPMLIAECGGKFYAGAVCSS